MRYLRKREMLAYYILYKKGDRIEYNEAIEEISGKLCIPRHVSRHILKRLRNTGYIEIEKRHSNILVLVRDLYSVFDELLDSYARKRCNREGKNSALHVP